MPLESIKVSTVLPASADRIFRAWISPKAHTEFSGGKATGGSKVGAAFTAWDGYIQGKTLVLDPPSRIVQSWRTAEFPEGSADSKIVVTLEAATGGTRITIAHTDIPEGQGARYEQGWVEHYFQPMAAYFAKDIREAATSTPAKKPAPKGTEKGAKKGAKVR